MSLQTLKYVYDKFHNGKYSPNNQSFIKFMLRYITSIIATVVAVSVFLFHPASIFADDFSESSTNSTTTTTLVATKIVCDNETDLPHWGNGGPDITASAASDFISSHQSCHFQSNWSFEWGYSTVTDPGRNFIGVAGNGWHMFGVTDQNGRATTTITDLHNTDKIWIREVLEEGYIPFLFDGAHLNNSGEKSAEMYCHDDVLNYDNYDFVRAPEIGKTYYCVAFNVKNVPLPPINSAPVITLLGNATTTITVGDAFTDPGATAQDEEDGNITPDIAVTGSVATTTIGTYTLHYNVKDSKGLSAEEKTRVVVVQARVSECSNIVVVSDETNTVLGGGNAVLTYSSNPRWTAVVPGASWIWKTIFVTHPLQDETNTFVKNFDITGEVASSTLLVAVDNSYKVWVNDVLVGADTTEFNYFESGKDTYFITNELHEGTNTIKFEVKNWKLFGGTAETNPAGLLYRLEISRNTCAPPPVNHAPVITVLDNPLHLTVGDSFDPFAHATTTDPDGDIVTLYASSTVSTTTAGTYQVDYTAEDSHGLSAEPKTLTVVVAEAPMCRLPEFTSAMSVHATLGTAFSYTFTATSTGTTTPVFTVATSSLPAGLTFFLGAITGTTTATGTFTIAVSTQNMCGVSTSTLSIIVDPNGGGGGSSPECSDGKDNDGDGKIDSADSVCHTDGNPNNPDSYTPSKNTENSAPVITLLGNATTTITVGDAFTDPGATAQDEEDGNITPDIAVTGSVATTTIGTYTLHYNVKDSKGLSAEEKTRVVIVNEKPVTPPGGGGGGGGGGCSGNCGGGGGAVLLPSLQIFNETIEKTPISGIVLIKWQTNIPSDSRVAYGTSSITALGAASLNYGYSFGTPDVPELVTVHMMAVSGLNPEEQYYFRPVSKQGTLSATGKELSLAPSECYYLREFIKFGTNNNPEEVKKLQAFLNSFEGSNLAVSGFYDVPTLNAVNAFQAKYRVDILDPWGHDAPTGYVYLTTRKQVNEIYCRAAFPLNQIQSEEVTAFKRLLESLRIHGIIPGTTTGTTNLGTENQNGIVLGTTTPTELNELGNKTIATGSESILPSPVTGRSAFRHLLAAVAGSISNTVTSYWLAILFAALVVVAGVLLRKMYKDDGI
jgi:hypothetical protein